ncbi:hypothetical protein [Lysobacter enzymogenes]|uniref:hypothetical protein n=1 Tax=Lysobacter enzymogenes TaxID=69 RepID=UPI003D18777D
MRCGFAVEWAKSVGAEAPPTSLAPTTRWSVGGSSGPKLSVPMRCGFVVEWANGIGAEAPPAGVLRSCRAFSGRGRPQRAIR